MKTFFVDLYNGIVNGEVSCAVTAACGASANHSGPSILVLNDQGGGVMNVSDLPATLRAQMKHHEPIVCFEPGILSRDCSAGNRAYINICSTLRAQMGDNQPAVCYEEVDEQSEVPKSMGLPKKENLHDRWVISDTSCL